MSPSEIAASIASGTMAASKLLSASQPLWNKLPRWLAVALPVIVLWLPKVVELLLGVKTQLDLDVTIALCVAMLLPGLAEAERSNQ